MCLCAYTVPAARHYSFDGSTATQERGWPYCELLVINFGVYVHAHTHTHTRKVLVMAPTRELAQQVKVCVCVCVCVCVIMAYCCIDGGR